MREHLSLVRLSALAALLSAGCGEGAPLSDQGLREILAADPEELAALPAPVGRRVAERLEAARTRRAEEWRLDADPGQRAEALVRAADRGREEPVICATYTPSDAGARVGTLSDPSPRGEAATLPPLEDLGPEVPGGPRGAEDGPSRELEQRALAGHGGRLLRALLAARGAERLVRVVGWPTGAAGIGDAVYVNATWLAALSYLEEAPGAARPAPPAAASVASTTHALDSPSKSCEMSCQDSCNRCGQTACDDLGDGPLGVACKDYCHNQKVCSIAPPRRGAWRSSLRTTLWLLMPLLFMLYPRRRRR